ncbi:hypothetical protein AAJ72_01010 [Citromicrobium sp. RCC1885]|uniref:aspartyl protease family protein n=1 Tax=unclassified Citromicrobium TaxID=2630544 RepID=UPI0006C8FF9C|nr:MULTISPECIES: aspartyl protease family protein [unclassified Citromicrobium]KPM24386.1 hypothetical protein AAJ72_01010 [Citromicrobium sp. RCC1885]KPM27628.1 hypothetical protein AAJ74_01755 [Citromicrobium sp. RCC1878]MAO04593.1 hypothetical protein [Citromicrobium sp.]OAM10881.1 hypothetical protein A0U43_07645 [Citromicrobium sp. RCC1897]|tara:strand:- start:1809 stop:2948 length:1140 start_codon:yes stop_codon:yes gene_type:complete
MIARRSFLATTAAMGAVALSPARLLAQSNTITIPIRLTDDRVLIDCLLNGQGPWPLVVDTGGSVGLMEQAMVDRLGLKTVGKSPLGLIGAHRVYDMVLVDELSLGGVVRQAGALFAATDHVNFIEDAVGSLAAGVVTTMDSELDFDASQLRLYPSGAPDRSDWTRVEDAFVLEGNRYGSSWMFAPVTIGGQAFPIGLDTGSPTELRLSGEALEKSGLWDSPRWTPGSPDGKARIVRVPEIGFGGTILTDLIATLTPKSPWSYFEHGLVGLPILRRFDIATRPATKELFLHRNALPKPAPEYNRAGMWIDRAGKDVKVAVVGPGSPAAVAGIVPGDRLVGADFQGLIAAMQGPAGSVLPLEVRSKAGSTRRIDLTLADFL